MNDNTVVKIEPAFQSRSGVRSRSPRQLKRAELRDIAASETLVLATAMAQAVLSGMEMRERRKTRRLLLVLGSAAVILIGGADPTRMADGLAQILRLPARFVLGTLAGVRMVGLFAEDWRTMALARRARGIGDTGRLRRFFTMAFALLVFAIRRGTKLATAMEARGFGSQRQRSWARPSRLGRADLVGLLVALAAGALSIGLALWADTFWLVLWDAT